MRNFPYKRIDMPILGTQLRTVNLEWMKSACARSFGAMTPGHVQFSCADYYKKPQESPPKCSHNLENPFMRQACVQARGEPAVRQAFFLVEHPWPKDQHVAVACSGHTA